jgi:hypothetical protein
MSISDYVRMEETDVLSEVTDIRRELDGDRK